MGANGCRVVSWPVLASEPGKEAYSGEAGKGGTAQTVEVLP